MNILSEPHFHCEVAAIKRLEDVVWPMGPRCPRCGGSDRVTRVKGGRVGLRRCGPCKREFTVTVGTIFERSHVKLHKWFQAAHLVAGGNKSISTYQLHRTLKVAYKTARLMEQRLSEAQREVTARTLRPISEVQLHGATTLVTDGARRWRNNGARAGRLVGGVVAHRLTYKDSPAAPIRVRDRLRWDRQ